jgi:two-component SAPR family response regulator
MTLEIRLLGPPTFTLSGQPLQLVRRKSIALLAWLAVTRRPQSREAITGLIWPEFDHESSLMNLRRDLSWLRKTLGDGFVAADRLQIAIEPDAPLWLDVQIFDSALSAVQKHNHPPTSLCPDCVANLSQAIELYQGDFMAGFSVKSSAGPRAVHSRSSARGTEARLNTNRGSPRAAAGWGWTPGTNPRTGH